LIPSLAAQIYWMTCFSCIRVGECEEERGVDGTECRYIVYRYRTLIVQTAMVQSIIVSALKLCCDLSFFGKLYKAKEKGKERK
jgi:hypothetical protein